MQLQTQTTRSQAGQTGLPLYAQGSTPPLSSDEFGAAFVTELNPRYLALTKAGFVFGGGNTAFAALTAVGTTVTGLTLFNPTNSGKNCAIIDITVAFTPVTLATVAITAVLAGVAQAATPTGVAALTPSSNLIGAGNLPVAKLYSAATLTTAPTIVRIVGNWQSTVLTTSGGATATANLIKDEIAGVVILQPGTVVCLAGIGTVADATVAASITWAEIPV